MYSTVKKPPYGSVLLFAYIKEIDDVFEAFLSVLNNNRLQFFNTRHVFLKDIIQTAYWLDPHF